MKKKVLRRIDHSKKGKPKGSLPHHGHSPFVLIWEWVTMICVMIVGIGILVVPSLHLEELAHHNVELAVEGAEVVLICEVALLLLVARNKIHYIKHNWMTILAVTPLGGSLRFIKVIKLGWHALEKTKLGHFVHHPIRYTKQWLHRKIGLRSPI